MSRVLIDPNDDKRVFLAVVGVLIKAMGGSVVINKDELALIDAESKLEVYWLENPPAIAIKLKEHSD